MASLNDLYIKLETLETLVNTLKKKGEKGVKIMVSISDEANDYAQNVSSHVSQSKEQADAKTKKFYVGNGKTVWANDSTFIPEKTKTAPSTKKVDEFDDESGTLPF